MKSSAAARTGSVGRGRQCHITLRHSELGSRAARRRFKSPNGDHRSHFRPQSAVAVPDEGGSITIHSATQSLDAMQRAVAVILGIPFHQVGPGRRSPHRFGAGSGMSHSEGFSCLMASWQHGNSRFCSVAVSPPPSAGNAAFRSVSPMGALPLCRGPASASGVFTFRLWHWPKLSDRLDLAKQHPALRVVLVAAACAGR